MANLNDLVHQFFQVSRAMTKDLNHRMAPLQLTQSQLGIIEYLLIKDGSSSLVDIAKYLSVEKSSVTRAVKHLETHDFIERAPSEDSRERRIILSSHAQDTQHDLKQAKKNFEANTFKDISEEELDVTFQTYLKC